MKPTPASRDIKGDTCYTVPGKRIAKHASLLRSHRIVRVLVGVAVMTMAAHAISFGIEPADLPAVDSILSLANTATFDTANSDIMVILDAQRYVFVDSLHAKRREHRAVQILNRSMVDIVGDERITYSSRSSAITAVAARTILPSGEVIVVDSTEFRLNNVETDMSTEIRSLTWLYPRVDSGAIIEYAIEFDVTLERQYDLSLRVAVSEPKPIRRQTIEVACPDEWQIEHEESALMTFHKSVDSGYQVLRWQGDSIPATEWEVAAPPIRERSEWISVYTSRSWDAAADWFWERVEPRITMDDSIAAVARKYSSNHESREDKISAIFERVSRDVRYELTPLRNSPPEPRDPRAVLSTGFGDCKDKSGLLIALLRAINISALPALTTSDDTTLFDPENADARQFDHMIVYLPDDGGIFVDPTCDICRWDELSPLYSDKPALVIGEETPAFLRRTPRGADSLETTRAHVRVVLDSAGTAHADVKIRKTGAQIFHLSRSHEDKDTTEVRRLVQSHTNSTLWEDSRITAYEVRIPDSSEHYLDLVATYRNDSLFGQSRRIILLKMNLEYALPYLIDADTVERTLDYVDDERYERHIDMMIVHGPHWSLENSRVSWVVDTTWFSARSEISAWADSSLVSISFRMDPYRVSPREYAQLTSCVEMLKARSERQHAIYRRVSNPEKMRQLETALLAKPNDISVLAALSQLHLGDDYGGLGCNGQTRRAWARNLLERAWRVDLSNEIPFVTMVGLLLIDNLYTDADSLMKEFLSQHPRSSQLDAMRTEIANGLGRYQEALEILKRNTDQSPDVRKSLIHAYAKVGDRASVESELSLLELLGDDPETLRDARMRALIEVGDFAEAESILTSIPDLDENYRYEIMSAIVNRRGDHAASAQLYAEALTRNPDDPLTNNNYAWNLAWRDSLLDVALAAAQKAIALSGQCNWGYRNTLGFVLLKLGRLDEARSEFVTCLAAQNASSRTTNYYCLAECDRLQADVPNAIKNYRRAIEAKGDPVLQQLAVKALSDLVAGTTPE